jgi:D-arabinose 1-dehydrogenase-like Zn-dependent alcohol dehydrogenase
MPTPPQDFDRTCVQGALTCDSHTSAGVVMTTLQISKLLGARVVAVTRGTDKAAFLQRLGADAVIDTAAAGPAGQRLHKLVAAAAPKGELKACIRMLYNV